MHRHQRDGESVVAPEPNRRKLTHLIAPWSGGGRQLWVGLSEIEPGSSSNLHHHPNEEVFFVLGGTGKIAVDGDTYEVEAGSAVLAPPDAPHRIENDGSELLRVLCSASPAFEKEAFEAAHALERSSR